MCSSLIHYYFSDLKSLVTHTNLEYLQDYLLAWMSKGLEFAKGYIHILPRAEYKEFLELSHVR